MTTKSKSHTRPGSSRGGRAASRVRQAIESANRESARKKKNTAAELAKLQMEYRRDLRKVLGRQGIQDLDALRKARLTRSRRIKQSLAVLGRNGVERARILELRLPYLTRARDILDGITSVEPFDLPYPACSNPWVSYQAPFTGYSWAWSWERTSNPSNPVLERYLDTLTGTIGSSIRVNDDDTGDDDSLSADYYTGLSVWHTPLSTGVLEGYLVFEVNNATYSGKIRDEFGFSDITYTQGATATLLAADAFDPIQKQSTQSPVYGFTDFIWGDDISWDRMVSSPRDRHWYFFRTTATFQQGSSVLLEAGLRHFAWFETNDESVSMSADLNLRLDTIMVRSCDPEIIL